ncbi:hypothetical protein HOK021_54480 [Streptomyces hygroscopicus]|nr:hypothetical protein HOK021_54480 [Streptomyces hygroscopicus]
MREDGSPLRMYGPERHAGSLLVGEEASVARGTDIASGRGWLRLGARSSKIKNRRSQSPTGHP